MSVYLETQQTVTQSKTMAQFSFGFTEGSFLQLNGQKLLRSKDLISNKQERTKQVDQKRRRHGHCKAHINISQ